MTVPLSVGCSVREVVATLPSLLPPETRTYTFDAETEKELKEWRETMQNVQLKLFAGDGVSPSWS